MKDFVELLDRDAAATGEAVESTIRPRKTHCNGRKHRDPSLVRRCGSPLWSLAANLLVACVQASRLLCVGPNPRGGPVQVIGFGLMQYLDEDAHLSLPATARGWQRRGIATRMVRWLERCALTAGFGIVSLEVRASNDAALAFYASLGYRPVTPLRGYYQGREDGLRLSRDLWFPPVDREPDRSPPQPG
jgi:ribosomal protein S18 acetylase RimI-like enzyme